MYHIILPDTKNNTVAKNDDFHNYISKQHNIRVRITPSYHPTTPWPTWDTQKSGATRPLQLTSGDGLLLWAIVKKQITSKVLPRKITIHVGITFTRIKQRDGTHPYVKLYIMIFVASQVFWRKSVGLRSHIYCCNGTSPLFGDSVCFFCNRWSGHQKDIPSLLYTFWVRSTVTSWNSIYNSSSWRISTYPFSHKHSGKNGCISNRIVTWCINTSSFSH